MTKHLVLFALIITSLFSHAQSIKKTVKNGDKAFEQKDYISASEFYEQAMKISPIEKVQYKLALTEFYKRDYKYSLQLFKVLEETSLSKYPLCEYYIALNLKHLSKHQQSLKYFHSYYKKHRRTRDFYTLKTKHELVSTEKAFDFALSPDTTVNLIRLDSLSTDDHSELLFYSASESESYLIAKRPININDTLFSSRLFLVNNDTIQALDSNINKTYHQIGGFCLSPDKNEAYISACYKLNGVTDCSIYHTQKTDKGWGVLNKLSNHINQENANQVHPFMFNYKNADYLLFASNRENSVGGYDIYYSQKKQGQWTKSKNLGRRINSIENEICPSFDTLTGRLYFSSEWFYNNGGYDIFYSNSDFPEVDIPENLGLPINSSYDDLYYTWSHDHSQAFLSSNRLNPEATSSATCCNSIFTYKLPEIEMKEIPDSVVLAKKVEQLEQLIPIDLYFDNDRPNPKTRDTVTNLSYEQTYEAYFNKIGEYETAFSEGLKKEAKENAVSMIDDFFYDKVEGGFEKLKAFNAIMLRLLQDGYDVELVVKGFASPLNSNSYNINLSKRRVSSIVNYYKTVEEGLFNNYINAESGQGKLIIKEQAFGENTASLSISDDRKDTKNSIYSPWAAEERRVQILAFKLNKKK